MKKTSLEVVGIDLSVEQDIPSYDDIIRMQRLDRDRSIDTFKELLSLRKKTEQYKDRLGEFTSYKRKHYPDTYWLS